MISLKKGRKTPKTYNYTMIPQMVEQICSHMEEQQVTSGHGLACKYRRLTENGTLRCAAGAVITGSGYDNEGQISVLLNHEHGVEADLAVAVCLSLAQRIHDKLYSLGDIWEEEHSDLLTEIGENLYNECAADNDTKLTEVSGSYHYINIFVDQYAREYSFDL